MASLTSAQRKALSTSDFAIPAKRSYPIDTIERARDSLARVSANGNHAEQMLVHRAVMARYPTIDHTQGPSAPTVEPAHDTAARAMRARMNA